MFNSRRITPILTCLSLIGLLAACQATSQGRTSRTVTGQSLGKSAWQNIPRVKSQISIVGDDSLIIGRRANYLPLRYQESLGIKGGGSIFYEELYSGYFGSSDENHYLINNVAGSLKKLGIIFTEADIKKSNDFDEGSLIYAVTSDATRKCMVFNSHFGDITYGVGNKHMFGRICQFINRPLTRNIEQKVLKLLNNMRFDGGKLNESMGPAKTDPKPRSKSSSDVRELTVKWENEPELTKGTVSQKKINTGDYSVRVAFDSRSETCSGFILHESGATGNWTLKWSNGKTAKGKFTGYGAGQGGKGTGKDSDNRKFEFEIGPRS